MIRSIVKILKVVVELVIKNFENINPEMNMAKGGNRCNGFVL